MSNSKYIFIAFLFVAVPCSADNWSLQINTVSHHPDENGLNERNTGFGLQYEIEDKIVTRYAVGTLINSMNDRTWYAGVSYGPRIGQRSLYIVPAVFVGAITYPSSDRAVIPAALPVLTIGSGPIAVNAVYVPKVGDKSAAAVLFQLTLRLD